jgi:hypothetical protein
VLGLYRLNEQGFPTLGINLMLSLYRIPVSGGAAKSVLTLEFGIQATIKNKFVSPPQPTEIFLLEICRHFFLDSFHQKINIFSLPSTSLSSKKKPTYLPTSKIVGWVIKGKQKCF